MNVRYVGEEAVLKANILRNMGIDIPQDLQAVFRNTDVDQNRIANVVSSALGHVQNNFAQALGALAMRMTVIRGESERIQGESKIYFDRNVSTDLFGGIFKNDAPSSDQRATGATRDRIRAQDRLLAVARRLFDRDLSDASLAERIGTVPANVPAVRDWMFRRATSEFLLPSRSANFPVRSESELGEYDGLRDYLRVLPTDLRRLQTNGAPAGINAYLNEFVIRNGNVDHITKWMAGRVIAANLSRRNQSSRPQDIGDRLNDTRFVANNSLIRSVVSSSRYADRWSTSRDEITVNVASTAIQKAVDDAKSPLEQKKELFRRWILDGIRREDSDPHDVARQILAERSGTAGGTRPEQTVFERTMGAARKFFQSSEEAAALENERKAQIQFDFSVAAAELYSAAFADDIEEMRNLRLLEIDPFLNPPPRI